MGPNSGSHRFHPYGRHDVPSSQGAAVAKVDASRDPRLKMRGNNGGNGNGNGGSFSLAASNGNNGNYNNEPSARNVINTSRDPRTRR